jgi:threonyl-tRNA synthetase
MSCASSCNRSAAVLLAAVTSDLLPSSAFVSAGATRSYFFCDFLISSALQGQMLPFIEERMRLVFKEGKEVRTLEMVPSNAVGMLRSRGLVKLAERLESSGAKLISLIQCGAFAAPFPFELPSEFSPSHFRLIEAFAVGPSLVRIVGAAGDKVEVKTLLKQPPPSSFNHLSLVEKRRLLTHLQAEDVWVWRSGGERLRAELIDWWKGACAKQKLSLISTPAPFWGAGDETALAACHLSYMRSSGDKKTAELAQIVTSDEEVVGEGLLSPKIAWVDRAYTLMPLATLREKLVDEVISSLQFILQIPKILGFEFEVIVSLSGGGSKKHREASLASVRRALEVLHIRATEEKRKDLTGAICIELKVFDSLGRGWTGPFLKLLCGGPTLKEEMVVVRSVFGSLERLIALILERRECEPPLDKMCAELHTVCYNET